MHAGSSVHAVLQAWSMSRWRREPFATERFKALFNVRWLALQAESKINWDGEEEAERSSSWRALEHYFTETPIKADEKPEAVEVSVSADLSKHGLPTLVGVIDLVRSGGRIVDFKLVGKTPDPEMVVHTTETQLTAYSILYRDATGRQEGGLELHHLIRTKQPKLIVTSLPPASQQQHDRLFRSIESYQQGVARQDFVPSARALPAWDASSSTNAGGPEGLLHSPAVDRWTTTRPEGSSSRKRIGRTFRKQRIPHFWIVHPGALSGYLSPKPRVVARPHHVPALAAPDVLPSLRL